MHHNLSEIRSAREKGLANPQEIVLALAVERNAGAHSGMAEKVRADGKRGPQRADEIQVGLRNRRLERFCGLAIALSAHHQLHRHAVGSQGFQSAQPAPVFGNSRLMPLSCIVTPHNRSAEAIVRFLCVTTMN